MFCAVCMAENHFNHVITDVGTQTPKPLSLPRNSENTASSSSSSSSSGGAVRNTVLRMSGVCLFPSYLNYIFNTPATPSTNNPSQCILSISLIDASYQHTLSTPHINTFSSFSSIFVFVVILSITLTQPCSADSLKALQSLILPPQPEVSPQPAVSTLHDDNDDDDDVDMNDDNDNNDDDDDDDDDEEYVESKSSSRRKQSAKPPKVKGGQGQGQGQGRKRVRNSSSSLSSPPGLQDNASYHSTGGSSQTKPAAKKVKYDDGETAAASTGQKVTKKATAKKPAASRGGHARANPSSSGGSNSNSSSSSRAPRKPSPNSSSSSSRKGKKQTGSEIDFVKYYTALQVHPSINSFC